MLFALAGLFYLLTFVCAIASLVFFIMVLVQMFKRDQANLGIICIVLTICVGIGPLVVFIYGWMKATEWNLKKTMTYWTAAIVLQILFIAIAVATAIGGAATLDPNQFNIDPGNTNIEFPMDGADVTFPNDSSMPDDAPQPEGSPFDQPEASPTDQP